MSTLEESSDDLRYGGALIVILVGLAVIALLSYFLPVKESWKAADVIALVGTLTTFLGTVVGAFLGVQVGAAGKQKAENLANRALGALAPAEAARVIKNE
jgi:uncharacterized membrane protein